MIFDMVLNQAVIMPPLQQQLWDKTLNVPLAGGFVSFFHDNARTTPKDVYELVGTGPGSYSYVNIGSVLQLSGIGTYIDSSGGNIPIYLWPFAGTPNDQPPSTTADNYYITVYSSTGVFQFDIPNWPGVSAEGGGGGNTSTSDNIISNGQFVDVDFPTTATSTNPQTFNIASGTVTTEIAPDWSVITTGTGTVNVWQIPISGATNNIGNPAYALGISTTGFSLPIQLTQKILAPRILASTPVSATFIAQSNGANVTLSMTYTPSITGAPQTLASGTAVSADYSVIANATPISITNPGVGNGFVNVSIVIPNGVSVNISCVQLAAAINNTIVGYIQETPEREIDHLFHYFQPKLNFKPISSLLVGWDFAMNPKQIHNSDLSPITSFTNSPKYVWDQTICCSVVGTVNVAQSTIGGFQFATTNPSEAVYMLQYLSSKQALLTALSRLSVNLYAFASTSNVVARVYLFYGNLSSSIPTLPTSIGTLAANGVFTLTAANWAQINQGLAFSNQVTLGTSLSDFGFSSWDNTANNSTTANFAIVVTFSCPTSGTNVVVQSTSCVPGDIPTRPAPLSFDQTLRLCQYYYEDTTQYEFREINMDSQALPGASPQPTVQMYPSAFTIDYKTVKRAVVPSLTVYSAVPTINLVTTFLFFANGSGNIDFINPDVTFATSWEVVFPGLSGITYRPIVSVPTAANPVASVTNGSGGKTVSNSLFFVSGVLGLYYIADARLGVLP
jgi:hypothetical protein